MRSQEMDARRPKLLLMIGPTGAGKSSFINALRSLERTEKSYSTSKISVIGPYGAGKSAFINALSGVSTRTEKSYSPCSILLLRGPTGAGKFSSLNSLYSGVTRIEKTYCSEERAENAFTTSLSDTTSKLLRFLAEHDAKSMLLLCGPTGAGKSSFLNSLYIDVTRIEKTYCEKEKGESQNQRGNTILQSRHGIDSYRNLERLLYWVENEQSQTGGLGGQCESFWESPWQSKGIYESGTKNDSYEEDSESGGSDGQGELCWKHPQVKSPDVVTSESGTNKDQYEEDAEAEIREVEQLLMCKVCLDKDSCIVFFPCRHMATCESCESFLQRCPVCRSQINKAVRINEY